jgi:hypothetical protein
MLTILKLRFIHFCLVCNCQGRLDFFFFFLSISSLYLLSIILKFLLVYVHCTEQGFSLGCFHTEACSVSMETQTSPARDDPLTRSSGWAPSILQDCITPSPPSGTGANLVPRPAGCLRLQQHVSSKRGDTAQESENS